ncbi:MAG: mitochondrial fission ELM1 family protein [Pseudomonadota bacterium]
MQAKPEGHEGRQREVSDGDAADEPTRPRPDVSAAAGQADDAPTLEGRDVWLISDGKAGMITQLEGVTAALGMVGVHKRVTRKGLARLINPWGGVPADVRFGQDGSAFAPPWPPLAIATGPAAIPYIRKLKRVAGRQTYTVVLLDPKTPADTADLIWVPRHDRRRGANVMHTLASPHPFSQARLATLRAQMPDAIADLPGRRIAVILGGNGGGYRYRDADDARLGVGLRALADTGDVSFMITRSRRTHDGLIAAAVEATRHAPHLLYEGEGANPYPDFLAHADALVVTGDSVNMVGEAAATGRPVFVFHPSGGRAKFHRFHAMMEAHGATRAFDAAHAMRAFGTAHAMRVSDAGEAAHDSWAYTPLDSAAAIAREIVERWRRRNAMLT